MTTAWALVALASLAPAVPAAAALDPPAAGPLPMDALSVAGRMTSAASLADVVREATAWQAHSLGVPLEPRPVAFGLPSQEVAALLPDGFEADPSALAALDALPGPQRDALARVVAAFRGQQAATAAALSAVPLDAAWLRAATDPAVRADPSAFAGLLAASGPVLEARLQLFEAAELLRSAFGTRSSSATLDLCPYVALDLAGTADGYSADCMLIVDVGGDDSYLNNAGGSRVGFSPGLGCLSGTNPVNDLLFGEPYHHLFNSAALIDLAGDDRHQDSLGCGVSGGGMVGSGFLYDAAGSDFYGGPTNGVAGGANAGWGFLYDASGDDDYEVNDLNDGGLGLNGGGGRGGVGALIDGGGNDDYTGSQQGANGGADTGSVGVLYDGGGHDTYLAGSASTNGGAVQASHGLLVDAAGNDRVTSLDVCSFDTCQGVNGGASTGGNGLLYDAAGHDSYVADSQAANGGAGLGGAGSLVDLAGDDTYHVNHGVAANGGGGIPFSVAGPVPGLGLLLDHSGRDTYFDHAGGTGIDRTVVPKGLVGAQVDLAALPVPDPRVRDNGDGSFTVWNDADHDGQQDAGEAGATTPPSPSASGLSQRTLLHEEGVGVEPQPLPPAGTGGVPVPDVPPQPGQPVPDVPGQPGQAVPDVPATPGQPVPDHGGAGPVPTPGVGEEVGVLSLRDSGTNYCAYFTPEGGSEQLLACAGRSFLGPLDPSMPRGDSPLVFYDPPDVPGTGPVVTPDVPPTPPVATPNVPPTGPVATPNVPPTPGQPTPDVPPVPVGSLGESPAATLDVDVSYRYDAARLTPFVNVAGHQTWSPVAPVPADLQWLASPGNPASLTLTVTVYKDGVSQGTVSREIPALGQALAAAEMSAGTL